MIESEKSIHKHPLVKAFERNPIFFKRAYNEMLGKMSIEQVYDVLVVGYNHGWVVPGCIPPTIRYPMMSKYSTEFIIYGRELIYHRVVEAFETVNPEVIEASHVANICSMYFDIFVGHHPKYISYSLDKRKKGKIGECITTRKGEDTFYKITISPRIIYSCFSEIDSPQLIINGIPVTNRVQIMMITLEHEIAHYLINNSEYDIVKMKSQSSDKVYGHHGNLFKDVVMSYFEHTGTSGSLLSQERIVMDFAVGERVSFTHAGNELSGDIIRINKKTIKVLVKLDETDIAHCHVHPSMLKRCIVEV